MLQFSWGIALIAAMILNCGAAFAEVDRTSANYRMQGCREFLLSSLSSAQHSPLAQGFCAGAVGGIGYAASGVCVPPGVTTGQMVRVVVKSCGQKIKTAGKTRGYPIPA